MKQNHSTMTYQLAINGELVQVQIAAGIHRRMERQAAAAGIPLEEVI